MTGSNSSSDPELELQLVVDRLRAEVVTLRQSRRRIVEAESADRRMLERALHDGLQQRLVALAVDVQQFARQLERDPASANRGLDELATNLREALAEATTLAELIYPALLDRRGLASSLRSVAARAGVTVLVDVPPGADYPPEVSEAVYWSCVAALASASPGSQAEVSVRDAEGGVTFEVAVAGRYPDGFVDRLRDRIEALDGRLTVDVKGLASRVQGWLPLSR